MCVPGQLWALRVMSQSRRRLKALVRLTEGSNVVVLFSCVISSHTQTALELTVSNPAQHSEGGFTSGPVTYEKHGSSGAAAESQLGGLLVDVAALSIVCRSMNIVNATTSSIAIAIAAKRSQSIGSGVNMLCKLVCMWDHTVLHSTRSTCTCSKCSLNRLCRLWSSLQSLH